MFPTMKRHTIDKFGAVSLSSAFRQDELKTDDPASSHEHVTRDYLDSRQYVTSDNYLKLSQRVDELNKEDRSLITLDGNDLDMGGRRIKNVLSGINWNDVSIIGQTCTYDETVGNFKCGTRYFNLVENSANCPILCGNLNESGEVTLGEYGTKTEVKPKKLLYYEPNSFKLTDNNGTEIVWDETKKRFCEIYYVSFGGSRN